MLNNLVSPRTSGERRPATGGDRPNQADARLNPWLHWRPARAARSPVLSVADLAECTCPDLCDRDHGND
jgi:hypothetical protein